MLWHYSFLAGLLATATAAPTSADCPDNTTMANSWDDVSVSTDLKYQPCFQNYTCAYLQVPLDYDNSSAGTANIAFLKYSSPNQPALGDLLLNSGGPGESPVQFLMEVQPFLSTLFGDSFNLVAMDPRGVNNSGPNVDCFAETPAVRDFWQAQLFDIEPRSPDSIRKYYEASGAFGTWCTQALNDSARYVNTPATTQDMLQYFEKLAESEGKDPSSALVNYYGVSYGSALGTTFANLYPDRVGRFIIDGVVDGEDYYFGNWSQNILQADAAMGAFFDLCAKAGPACALYGNGSTTAVQIKNRVDSIIGRLAENPFPVINPSFVDFPTVVTHVDLLSQVLPATYKAVSLFAPMATVLAQLDQGNASTLALAVEKGQLPAAPCDHAASSSGGEIPKLIIACNDNNKHYKGTEKDLFDLFKYNEGLSTYLGDIWTPVIVPQCRNLNFTPPENQLFQGYKKVTPKTPILFTDNTIDPVASSYYKMSAFFEGSAVLFQDAIAHGLTNSESKCINNYLDTYLRTLQLPPANTTCAADIQPFFFPLS